MVVAELSNYTMTTAMIARQMFSSVTEAANESSENETWTDDGEEVVLIPGADEYGSDSDEEDSRLPPSPHPDSTPPVVSDPPPVE